MMTILYDTHDNTKYDDVGEEKNELDIFLSFNFWLLLLSQKFRSRLSLAFKKHYSSNVI